MQEGTCKDEPVQMSKLTRAHVNDGCVESFRLYFKSLTTLDSNVYVVKV